MTDQKEAPGADGRGGANAHLKSRVRKGAFWFMSGTAARAMLRLIVMAVLARLLMPADFGLVGAASIFVAFAELFSISGIGLSIVQLREIQSRHVQTAYTTSALTGIVVGGTIWLISGPIAALLDMPRMEPILEVLALLFPLNSLAAVSQKLLERELAYGKLAAIEVASYFFGYSLFALSFALAGFGVWALVYAQLASAFVRITLLLRVQPHALRLSFDRRSYLELMRTGLGFSLARYANFVAQKGDYFVVGRWLGAAPLGLYERAYVLMDLSNSLLTNALNTILFPAFSKLQANRRALAAAFERVSAILALVFLPVGIASSLLAPEIIRVLLGGNWGEAVAPFQVLALAMFFRTAMKISSVVLTGAGSAYRVAWSQTIYGFFVVAGALVMVRYGITAVAFATLAALIVTYLVSTRQALRLVNMSWRRLAAAYLPALAVAPIVAGTILIVALPMRMVEAPPLLILIAAGGATLTLLSAILFTFPRLYGPHARWLLDQLPINLFRR